MYEEQIDAVLRSNHGAVASCAKVFRNSLA